MAKNTVATKSTGDQLTAAELNEIASVQNTNDDLRAAALSAANAAQADATQAISDAATAQSSADSKLTQAQVDARIQGSSFTVVDGANELTFDVPHEYTDAGNVLVGGDPSFTLAASGNVANTYKTIILDQPTTITLSADFEYEGQGTDPLTLLGTTYTSHVFTILMRYDEYQDKVFYVVPLPQASSTDITLPTVTSATVEDADPDALVVVFSEAVTVADVTGLSLDGSWTGISVSSVTSGSGTATVTFALSGPIAGGESGNFVYGGTNTIDDLAGNSLAAGSTAVTNNVAGASIIVFQDDFTGATIDTASWNLVNPDTGRVEITQNDTLSVAIKSVGTTTIGANRLDSDGKEEYTLGSSTVIVSFDATKSDQQDVASVQFGLWKTAGTSTDRIDFATGQVTSSNQVYCVMVNGGSTDTLQEVVLDISTVKTVRIKIVNTVITWEYWTGAAWSQLATTTVAGLSGDWHLMIGAIDNSAATIDTMTFDNLYVSNADYSTQYPT